MAAPRGNTKGGHRGPPLQKMQVALSDTQLQTVDRALQRSFAPEQVCPQVTNICDALGQVAQRKCSWSNFAALQLFPRTRRRHWRARLCTHSVGGCIRRAVTVAPGVDENATATIDFAELLRQVFTLRCRSMARQTSVWLPVSRTQSER